VIDDRYAPTVFGVALRVTNDRMHMPRTSPRTSCSTCGLPTLAEDPGALPAMTGRSFAATTDAPPGQTARSY
jgi:hypothetical protein